MAAVYLKERHFEILLQNWRHKNWEVDIIATKEGVLHFIEVKTRTSRRYGYPEEGVDIKKIKYLINAAEAFLYQFPQWQRIQFDVLAITLVNPTAYFFIEDVYFW